MKRLKAHKFCGFDLNKKKSMAAVEFFSNCCGVEPKTYTKYVKTKPLRPKARTIKQKTKSIFDNDDDTLNQVFFHSKTHRIGAGGESSLFSKKILPEALNMLNESGEFEDED